ncbi:Os02g0720450, partial [Oryza sativa Japonica Group]
EDPRRAEVHGRAAAERDRDRRQRHGAVPGEVVAGVQDPRRRRRRVAVGGHGGAERGPQRRVRRGRQPRDHRARVDHRARREHGRVDAQRLPADADAGEHHDVVCRVVRRRQQRRRGEAGGAARPAQRYVTHGVLRRR